MSKFDLKSLMTAKSERDRTLEMAESLRKSKREDWKQYSQHEQMVQIGVQKDYNLSDVNRDLNIIDTL